MNRCRKIIMMIRITETPFYDKALRPIDPRLKRVLMAAVKSELHVVPIDLAVIMG